MSCLVLLKGTRDWQGREIKNRRDADKLRGLRPLHAVLLYDPDRQDLFTYLLADILDPMMAENPERLEVYRRSRRFT